MSTMMPTTNQYDTGFQSPPPYYPAPDYQQGGRGGYIHGVRGGRIDKYPGARGGLPLMQEAVTRKM